MDIFRIMRRTHAADYLFPLIVISFYVLFKMQDWQWQPINMYGFQTGKVDT